MHLRITVGKQKYLILDSHDLQVIAIIAIVPIVVFAVWLNDRHRYEEIQQKKATAAAEAKIQQANQAKDQKQEAVNDTQPIDCSEYTPPTGQSDGKVSNYADAVDALDDNPFQAQCRLQCDLTNMTPLLGASKGDLSPQAYQSYVQQMQTNHCGTPKPYCQFTPSTPCTGSSPDNSGYDAGYAYGEQYQICDPNYDNGNSQAFNDGVNAWTDDNCNQ